MDPTTETALARLFAEVWTAFLDGGSIDAFDLEKLIERTGLCEWRDATAEDVSTAHIELDVGDPILCLTDAGKRVRDAGVAARVSPQRSRARG
jgi:hypothetical protein